MQQERPCPEVEVSKFRCWGVNEAKISELRNCSEDLKYKWLQLSQAAPKWFDQPLHPWTGELHSFGLVQCKEGTKDCRSYGKTYRVPWWNLSKDVVAFLLLFFVEKVYKSRRLHYSGALHFVSKLPTRHTTYEGVTTTAKLLITAKVPEVTITVFLVFQYWARPERV